MVINDPLDKEKNPCNFPFKTIEKYDVVMHVSICLTILSRTPIIRRAKRMKSQLIMSKALRMSILSAHWARESMI